MFFFNTFTLLTFPFFFNILPILNSRNVSPAGKVYYYFYNRNTQNNIIYGKGDVPTAIINSANFADLEEKLRHRFIITAETQIWIHGCAQFVNAYSNEDIEKIVKSKNHNVIIVDWTYSYSPFTCYTMKKQQFVVIKEENM